MLSAYSSIFESNFNTTDSVTFDGELWRGALRLRYGLGERTDVELEVAALYATSGFLDDFVNEFHDGFLLPDGGRSAVPDDQFTMAIERNGRTLFAVEEDRLAFADLPIIVTHALTLEEQSGFGLALRGGIELPTGSEARGFGNGGIDAGGGLLFEKSRGRCSFTAAIDYVLNDRPAAFEGTGVDARDLVQLQTGAEFRCSDRLSLLAGLFWTSPLATGIELEELDRELLDLGLGFAYDTGPRSRITFSFHEDLVAAAGPDFSTLIGWSTGL